VFKKVLLCLCAAVVSFGVMAKDDPVGFKVVSVEESFRGSDNNLKISVKDQKNGVFVLARGGWSSSYPKTAQMIKEVMTSRGIKVTDDPSNADIGIQFNAFSGADFSDIESQSSSIDTSKLTQIGLFGVAGLLAFVGDDKPYQAIFTAVSAESPSVSGRNIIEGKNKMDSALTVNYNASKKNASSATAAFMAYLNEYLNRHFVFDTPVSAATMPTAN
jgi:hypothetical protein